MRREVIEEVVDICRVADKVCCQITIIREEGDDIGVKAECVKDDAEGICGNEVLERGTVVDELLIESVIVVLLEQVSEDRVLAHQIAH